MRRFSAVSLAAAVSCLVASVTLPAAAEAYQAALVVDAGDGRVLFARNATTRLHPASLAKMMTAYLTLEAVKAGRLTMDTPVKVSAKAAAQSGSILGLAAGQSFTVRQGLSALMVRSANDVAVALAEHLAGGEEAFAAAMTAKAKALGLTGTTFGNATGLTEQGMLTTARDMAALALALRRDFPDHYALFGQTSMAWQGATLPTVNGFLTAFPGADGLKTGFTCHAGYNLVTSAERDGRRLVGVVMGAGDRFSRQAAMADLLQQGFAKAAARAGEAPTLQDLAREPTPVAPPQYACGPVPVVGMGTPGGYAGGVPSGWALEVGHARSAGEARSMAARVLGRMRGVIGGGHAYTMPNYAAGGVKPMWRALIVGAREDAVTRACKAMRAKGQDCLVFTPERLRYTAMEMRRIADARRRQNIRD